MSSQLSTSLLPPSSTSPSSRRPRTIANPVIRDTVTFISVSPSPTTILHITLAPTGRITPHYHTTYTETFRPLTGSLGLYLPDSPQPTRITILNPGDSKTVQKGERHAFFHPSSPPFSPKNKLSKSKLSKPNPKPPKNITREGSPLSEKEEPENQEEIKFEVILEPASQGFEKMLYIIYGLAKDGKVNGKGVPRNIIHACLVAKMSDTWVGSRWVRLLGGGLVVKGIAGLGRRCGVERRLVSRYWGDEEEEKIDVDVDV